MCCNFLVHFSSEYEFSLGPCVLETQVSSTASIVEFEQINVCWADKITKLLIFMSLLLTLINSFMMVVHIIKKPVQWFAFQINRLVSIW